MLQVSDRRSTKELVQPAFRSFWHSPSLTSTHDNTDTQIVTQVPSFYKSKIKNALNVAIATLCERTKPALVPVVVVVVVVVTDRAGLGAVGATGIEDGIPVPEVGALGVIAGVAVGTVILLGVTGDAGGAVVATGVAVGGTAGGTAGAAEGIRVGPLVAATGVAVGPDVGDLTGVPVGGSVVCCTMPQQLEDRS